MEILYDNNLIKEIYFKATPTMVYIIGHCRDHLPGSRGAGRLYYLVLNQKTDEKTYGIGEKFSGLFASLCLPILEKFSGIGLENIDQWCGFSFDWSLYLCHECFF
jgi:hypothetical protein